MFDDELSGFFRRRLEFAVTMFAIITGAIFAHSSSHYFIYAAYIITIFMLFDKVYLKFAKE